MIGKLYALATLILNIFKTSVAGSWPTRIGVRSYKERSRSAVIVQAVLKYQAGNILSSSMLPLRSYHVPDDPTKTYHDLTPIILRPIGQQLFCSADI
jgi:hypothetical protein